MAFFPYDVASPTAAPRPAVDWEEADCLLCGQRDWLPLIEAQDPLPGGNGLWFVVVQCQKCGLCFTNPRPTLATMDSFYLPSYSPHQGRSPTKLLADGNSIPAKMPRRYRNPFSALKPGRLLDFGCGSGRFIQRMRQRGWHVTGLDSSATAIELVRNQLGLNVMLGSLPAPRPAVRQLRSHHHVALAGARPRASAGAAGRIPAAGARRQTARRRAQHR